MQNVFNVIIFFFLISFNYMDIYVIFLLQINLGK